jgi:hypothetical protein
MDETEYDKTQFALRTDFEDLQWEAYAVLKALRLASDPAVACTPAAGMWALVDELISVVGAHPGPEVSLDPAGPFPDGAEHLWMSLWWAAAEFLLEKKER